MKTLKAICMAITLGLVLTIPVNAGDISTPGVTSSGEIGTPGLTVQGGTDSSTVDTTADIGSSALIDLLLTALSLV
jgi:hypothetical protein